MSHKHKSFKLYPGCVKGVFDTHAHLYDEMLSESPLGGSPEEILGRAASVGIDSILIPSDSIETSKAAIEYVRKWNGYEGISLYCSVGVHPHEAKTLDDKAMDMLEEMLKDRKDNRIAAVGEIGLDYYYDYSPRDVQKDAYIRQMELCHKADIPFILHEREASGDNLIILKEMNEKGLLRDNPGVCHCCSCSLEISRELLKLGFYLGFDGPITFKNNVKNSEVLANAPLDRIVIETDSPYLSPEPNRGLINEPSNVLYVLERLAELKGISVDEAAEVTHRNALNLYEINPGG